MPRKRSAIILILIVTLGAATARADPAYTGTAATVPAIMPGEPNLPATLLRPAGTGPFPAVVVLHDCSGLGPASSGAPGRWGGLLAGWGYVVLIPDSFAPRGYAGGVCAAARSPQLAKTVPRVRSGDAYAALAYLRTLPFIDPRHIAVIGGSHGGSSTLATLVLPLEPGLAAQRRGGFAAGVALYPGCGAGYGAWSVVRERGFTGKVIAYQGTYQPLAPLLILIGAEDDWTPAEHCRVLAERAAAAGYPVSITVYPGAYHSFDNFRPRHFFAAANNANSPTGHGATTGGDRAAWTDAIARVKAFFAARLK